MRGRDVVGLLVPSWVWRLMCSVGTRLMDVSTVQYTVVWPWMQVKSLMVLSLLRKNLIHLEYVYALMIWYSGACCANKHWGETTTLSVF